MEAKRKVLLSLLDYLLDEKNHDTKEDFKSRCYFVLNFFESNENFKDTLCQSDWEKAAAKLGDIHGKFI